MKMFATLKQRGSEMLAQPAKSPCAGYWQVNGLFNSINTEHDPKMASFYKEFGKK
jgi:hypothetical protein